MITTFALLNGSRKNMTAASRTGKRTADLKGPDLMGETLKCISPIDGSVYAERPVASVEEAQSVVQKHEQHKRAGLRFP